MIIIFITNLLSGIKLRISLLSPFGFGARKELEIKISSLNLDNEITLKSSSFLIAFDMQFFSFVLNIIWGIFP